jgi:hypothetical protein
MALLSVARSLHKGPAWQSNAGRTPLVVGWSAVTSGNLV